MSVETEITRIKTNIASAYTKAEEKGATLPEVQNSANLASTIESITGGGDEWQPEPDWWDIDKILEEDIEDCSAKTIALLSNSDKTYTVNLADGATKVVTSDGGSYIANGTHTWDDSKDKECSLGYKTRYVIRYYENIPSTAYRGMSLTSALYVIFKNLVFNVPSTNIHSWSPLSNAANCEYVKFKNCTFSGSNFSFVNCYKLKGIEGYTVQNNTTMEYMYQNVFSMFDIPYVPQNPTLMNYSFQNTIFQYIDYIDTSNVTSFVSCFNTSRAIVIENLDFNSATTINNMFNGAGCLVSINNVSNIKISGLNFTQAISLNHDTLIRILNALYDYSADTENTYTITLGATNLAKLTKEEIAIGTNKNWTIS